jgi:hypothetical protein
MQDYLKFLLAEGVGDVTMYHGSDTFVKKLLPNSINMGTTLSNPRWSVFLWRDRTMAEKWAVYALVRSTFRQNRAKGLAWSKATHDFLYNPADGTTLIARDHMEDWMNCFMGKSVYVYAAQVPVWKLGVGHSKEIEEYTIDETVPYRNVETIPMSVETMRRCILWTSMDEINDLKKRMAEGKIKPNLLRNLFGSIMHDDYFDDFNSASRGLAHGLLKPGQSITDYLTRT